jgi:hypothetical protein
MFTYPSFWNGCGRESLCVGRAYGADGAVRLVLSSWGVVRFNDQLKQGSYCQGFVWKSVFSLGGGVVCRIVHRELVERCC